MRWHVSVFTKAMDRLIWASGPVETLSEAARLARTAVAAGHRAFIRSPNGVASEMVGGRDD